MESDDFSDEEKNPDYWLNGIRLLMPLPNREKYIQDMQEHQKIYKKEFDEMQKYRKILPKTEPTKIHLLINDDAESSDENDSMPIKRERIIYEAKNSEYMKHLKLTEDEINMISNKSEDYIFNEKEKSILKKKQDLEEFQILDSKEYYCFLNDRTYFYNEMCHTLCYHDTIFSLCKKCEGAGWNLCRKCIKKYGKYNNRGYCGQCFSNKFPLEKHNESYKKKEFAVIDFILKSFPQFNWAHDETLEFNDKISTRRPDLILQLSNKCIIIEIDENQHKNKEYNILSERKRLNDILSYIQNDLKIIIIRFNPDNFYDFNCNYYRSCWKRYNKEKRMIIIDNKQKEWNYRLNILKKVVEKHLNINILPSKKVTIIKLFYDFFKSKNMKLHI